MRVHAACSLIVALAITSGPQRGRACCPPERVLQTTFSCPADAADGACDHVDFIGTDGLGGVYLLGEDRRIGDERHHALRVSRDDGETWSVIPLPAAELTADALWVAVDAAGHVVIPHVVGSQVRVLASADQARSFGPAEILRDHGADPVFGAQVAMSPGGRAAVAWAVLDADATGFDVWAAVSSDGGRSWGAAQAVNDVPAWLPFAVTCSESTVVVAWNGYDDPDTLLVADRSTDAGASWSADQVVDRVTRQIGPFYHVDLVTSGDGSFHVGYIEDALADRPFRVSSSLDDGVSWQSPTTLLGVSDGLYPTAALVATPSGRVNAFWPAEGAGPAYDLVTARSDSRGAAGTWTLPGAVIAGHPRLQEVEVAADAMGALHVVHWDGREGWDGPCPDPNFACASVRLHRSCDGGGTWPVTDLRIDEDGFRRPVYSMSPKVAVSPAGRIHVAWADTIDGGGVPSLYKHAAYDAEPLVIATLLDSGSACARASWRLGARSPVPTGGACPVPAFQWFMDGAPIAGATGSEHDVPPDAPEGEHDFHVVMSCPVALPCGGVSRVVRVDLGSMPPPPDIVDFDLPPSLRVERAGGGLRLSWTDDRPEALGYNVYAGTIASLWRDGRHDHASLACGVPRLPAGAATTTVDAPDPGVDTYFLVSPAGCLGEGGLGATSEGARRPVPGAGAPCGPLG